MSKLDLAAEEAFQILRSFDYSVSLWDDEGARVDDPKDARRMFAAPENLLLSVSDDGDNSAISLKFGKSTKPESILGLMQALRMLATRFNLLFHARRFDHEITPKDFAPGGPLAEAYFRTLAMKETAPRRRKSRLMFRQKMAQPRPEGTPHPMSADMRPLAAGGVTEGLYGTSRSSYLRLENARMIVRHSGRIDDSKVGARSRYIESIMVENADGERVLFPTRHLAPARAMTQHVNQGGQFHDQVSQQIMRMAGDYASLRTCSQHVLSHHADLPETAGAVREDCRARMRGMRRVFERLSRPQLYTETAARLQARAPLVEQDEDDVVLAEQMDGLRAVLTTEAISLDEAVLRRVCRTLAEDGFDEPATTGDDTELLTDADAGVAPGDVAPGDVAPRDDDEAAPAQPKDDGLVETPFGRVNRAAWIRLGRHNRIDLFAPPAFDPKVQFRGRTGIVNKLLMLVPQVKSPSLANLLGHVAEELVASQAAFYRPEDPIDRRKALQLASYVVHADWYIKGHNAPHPTGWDETKVGEAADLRHPLIREHGDWLFSFEIDRIMNEPYMAGPSWDSPMMEERELYLEGLVQRFDPDAFVDDTRVRGLLELDAADDPRVIPVDEVRACVADYFTEQFYEQFESETGCGPDDAEAAANAVLERALAALRARDVVVETEAGFGTADDAAAPVDEKLQLSREDVLLPKPNEQDDLKREVSPATMKDPTTGREIDGDDAESYLERLLTLTGQNNINP